MSKHNRGVLLAVSSLPGNHGIGDFGDSCYKFIDWLHDNKYRYWQVLPLNPIGPGNSPYMSTCSNAIDLRYISLDFLKEEGLLDELPNYKSKCTKVNYQKTLIFKKKYLHKAYLKFLEGNTEGFRKFKTRQPWVSKYATFEVYKEKNNGKCWSDWPIEERDYYLNHNNPPKSLLDKVNFQIFIQYIALKQWKRVLSYANKKNIKIICDMPFYVGFNGVECWLNRDQFSIDENCRLYEVGGVGPDAFSETGQLWGSPIYNFEIMKEDGYSLLIERIAYLTNLCDLLRIDHFRAFDTYYVIPANEPTAMNGVWKIGPQTDFFDTLYIKYPKINIIAEDLGELRPEVLELRDHYHLPGMFVNQFTLLDINAKSNDNQIVYSGTHDNETLYGWYLNLKPEEKKFIQKRLKVRSPKSLYNKIVEYILKMPSLITILPLQDLLKLDNEYRMNTPGTMNDINWTFKLKDFNWIDHIKYPKKGIKK